VQQRHFYSDADYTLAFYRGEVKGFTYFFRLFYSSILFFAYKMIKDKQLAEEIVSSAFIKIWQRHKQFDSAENIKTYLYRIVRNDAVKHLDQKKRQIASHKEIFYLYGSDHEKDHFNNLVRAETLRQLSDAINSLPAECSKRFRLMYIEGKKTNEIVKELGLSASTVKTQKARGLLVIKKRFLPQ
jgi:RNA polymerase sigma-70 factor (ECF subfamily)